MHSVAKSRVAKASMLKLAHCVIQIAATGMHIPLCSSMTEGYLQTHLACATIISTK